MTFRFKIFAAIVLVMTLIISLLTLNLWLEWYNRLRAERQAAGELLARTAQDWIPMVFTAPTPPAAEQIEVLVRQLRRSTLFEEWVIVDARGTPLASSHPGLIPLPADSTEDMEESLSTGRLVVRKNQVSAPLLLADGQKVAISMNLQRGLLAPVDPARQFSAVLVIMGMGTALLILTMYILLNRFVIRPLERLVAASGCIEAGDYTKEIPVGSR
ncbi:MAG: hypothetical protein RDV41_10835, partial [Planctomycetota bacterium]|nr:hypothetical protein [Planctomycetota bacterium]